MIDQPRRFTPQPQPASSGDFQVVPSLASLLEGKEAVSPLRDHTLYPPDRKGGATWRWLLMGLTSSLAASGVAVGAFLWLVNLPPSTDCQDSTSLTTDRAQLYCAQVAASSGELSDVVAGLDLVGHWPADHPLNPEVQPLVDSWSKTALAAARDRLQENDMDGAIALINRIPPSSEVYEPAHAALDQWQQAWKQGEAIYAEVQAALQRQDWQTAKQKIQILSQLDDAHWRPNQANRLTQQMAQEQQSQRLLAQAVSLASPGGVDQLSAALRAASQINQTTYTWKAAQPYLDRWSDMLIEVGLQKWYAGELKEAMAIGQRVSLNPGRSHVAQDLVRLSQARQLALKGISDWKPSLTDTASLYQALLIANQIAPDSPLYPQAQSSLVTWKEHLRDLGTLQVAQGWGRFQNREAINLAIATATAVPVDSPQRIQAQTLAAHWAKEQERMADRPYLVRAKRLAASGTIPDLLAAIDAASVISPDRALRPDAQGWIYQWRKQIETLEDQPTLDRAKRLAQAGNLSQAIAAVSEIRSDRALYDEAQAAIATWQQRIRDIELARQRAAQRAAERAAAKARAEAEAAADSADGNAAGDTEGTTTEATPGAASLTPEPVINQSPPRRSPLPARLETVPGPAPMVPAPAPIAPAAPALSSPSVPPKPLSPSDPAPITAPAPAPPSPAPEFSAPPPKAREAELQSQGSQTPGRFASTTLQTTTAITAMGTPEDRALIYTGALHAHR